jgi:hypothetical protein
LSPIDLYNSNPSGEVADGRARDLELVTTTVITGCGRTYFTGSVGLSVSLK